MNDASSVLLLARTALSLALILAMIWGASRLVRRRGRVAAADPTAIGVVARRSVGRRSNLLVVEVAGRTLLVGACDASVQLVADLTKRPATDPDDETTDGSTPTRESSVEIIELPVDALDGLDHLDLTSRRGPVAELPLIASLRARTVRRT